MTVILNQLNLILSPPPKNIKLSDVEWGNLQKAASFSVHGLSHAAWFREAAVAAVDDALPMLSPNVANEEACISKLQDLKEFLWGLEYSVDILVKQSV